MVKSGFNVKIKFTKNSAFYRTGTKKEILYNITEIHYCYPTKLPKAIAFKSDINGNCQVYYIDEVKEFKAKPATKKI